MFVVFITQSCSPTFPVAYSKLAVRLQYTGTVLRRAIIFLCQCIFFSSFSVRYTGIDGDTMPVLDNRMEGIISPEIFI